MSDRRIQLFVFLTLSMSVLAFLMLLCVPVTQAASTNERMPVFMGCPGGGGGCGGGGGGVGVARFVGQLLTGGDSGSLIVLSGKGANARKAVGLLFAGGNGYTVAHPIDAVLKRFRVTVDGELQGHRACCKSSPAAWMNFKSIRLLGGNFTVLSR